MTESFDNWEYTYMSDTTLALDRSVLMLNAHGSLGWEVVSITAADKTIGVNSMTALMKRRCRSLPRPDDDTPSWYPDTSGRFTQRFWDGLRWTEHVMNSDGLTEMDYPNVR